MVTPLIDNKIVSTIPNTIDGMKFLARMLLDLAGFDPKAAIKTLQMTPQPVLTNVMRPLYVFSRLPDRPRGATVEPFLKKVGEIADELGISNKKSRKLAMAALQKLTICDGPHDNSAELAAFEQKFLDHGVLVWQGLAASFTSLIESNVRLPLTTLIKVISDVIIKRVVSDSNDPEHEPLTILDDDTFDIGAYIIKALYRDGKVEPSDSEDFKLHNLELDEEGWVRRIAGTRTTGKSAAYKKAEKAFREKYAEYFGDPNAGLETYIQNFEAYLKANGVAFRTNQ